jgi:uncharacterized membrane protein YozB (DUF420 family)
MSENRQPAPAAKRRAKGIEKPIFVSRRTWVTAAVIAPMAISPSRAMLTTPERSQIIPPIAAIRMGETIIKVEGSIFQIVRKKSIIHSLRFDPCVWLFPSFAIR